MEAITITTRVVLLALFFLLVIYRMIVTIVPDLNIILHEPQDDILEYIYHKEIKSKDLASVVIWILVTLISRSLVLDIIGKRLDRSAFKADFHKILSLLSIISYEVWMFNYLYYTYASSLDWNFKVIISLPFVTLLVHSILQTFLSYDEYVLPHNKKEKKILVYFIITSMGFNGIMLVHVLFMFVTALSTGISNEKYIINVVFLGIGEMMYRAYVIKNHYRQLKNQSIPYAKYMQTATEYHMQQIRNQFYSRAELESGRVNLEVHVELVTGVTQNKAKKSSYMYLTKPIPVTVFVFTLSAFVAGIID